MTKKDYILLARTIRSFLDDYEEEVDSETMRKFTVRLARALKSDNVGFDYDKFYNAAIPTN